jgi:hypothetical protein
MKFLSYIFVLTFLTETAFACVLPEPGHSLNADQLIEEANEIFLVEFVFLSEGIYKLDASDGSDEVRFIEVPIKIFTVNIVEVVKGKKRDIANYKSYGEQAINNDFDGHSQKSDFWKIGIGRSEFPCCVCAPVHTFDSQFRYLIFPGLFGAVKSAEVIKSPKDKWYQYVKQKSF